MPRPCTTLNGCCVKDPKAFTLQLVTLSNADQASRMAQQHNLPEALARFRIQGQNQLLYVLTYGVFKEAAQQNVGVQQ